MVQDKKQISNKIAVYHEKASVNLVARINHGQAIMWVAPGDQLSPRLTRPARREMRSPTTLPFVT